MSTSNQDSGYIDRLHPLEELAINSGMDSYTQLLTTPLHENHSQSNNEEEVPKDDELESYLNDFEHNSNSVDPLQPDEMPTLEEIYKEDNKTVNMQLNVPVVENAGGEYQNSDVAHLNIDSNANGTNENNAGDEYQNSDVPYMNMERNTNGTNENKAGGENQDSDVPYLNIDSNTNGTNENNAGGEYQNSNVPYLNINSSTNGTNENNADGEFQNSDVPCFNMERNSNGANENVTPCVRKISTSDISTQKKRKKSRLGSEDKFLTNCYCKKSKCLQLYCECFSSGIYCNDDCGCRDCINQEIYEDTVQMEKQRIQSKNPLAFAPKNVRENVASSSGLKKGCKCKQSMCRKKYCECFQAGVNCTIACGCGSCRNPFGIREGSNNIAQGDRMTNLSRLFSGSEYTQLPNNFSSTFSPSLNNHNHDTPTPNLSNGSVHWEVSTFTPDLASLYDFLFENSDISLLQRMRSETGMVHYDQQFNFAPQPNVSRPSNQPPCYNNLSHQPSTSASTPYLRQGLSSNSMSYLRGNHLQVGSSSNSMVNVRGNHLRVGSSSNSMVNLRGSQQGISQTMPNFTSVIPFMNSNGSSMNSNGSFTHNGGDHRNVIPYMNSNGSFAQNGGDQRNAIAYMNSNGSSAQNGGDQRNAIAYMNSNGSSAQNGGDQRNDITYMNSNGSFAQNGGDHRNAIPYMNSNGGSAQNEDDHKDVISYMNSNGGYAQNGDDHRNAIYMNSNGGSAQNGDDHRNAT